MSSSGLLKNPVPLYNLLKEEVRQVVDGQVILTEDLYYRGVLILKIGTFLDEQAIYKLINFGFKRVSILLPDSCMLEQPGYENLSLLQLKKKYLRNQKCLIADKDGYHINELISIVKASFIQESNIFAVNNSIPIRKLIEEKHPRYIFIDLNLYPNNGLKVIKEMKKYSNAHIYLTALVDQSKTVLIAKLRKEVEKSNASLILKPVSSIQLRLLMLDTVSNNDIRKFLSLKRYLEKRFRIA